LEIEKKEKEIEILKKEVSDLNEKLNNKFITKHITIVESTDPCGRSGRGGGNC